MRQPCRDARSVRPLCQSFYSVVVLTGTDAIRLDTIRASLQGAVTSSIEPERVHCVKCYSVKFVSKLLQHCGFNGDGRHPTRYYPSVPTERHLAVRPFCQSVTAS